MAKLTRDSLALGFRANIKGLIRGPRFILNYTPLDAETFR